MMSWTTACLISVIIIQWILFTALLQLAKDQSSSPPAAVAASAKLESVSRSLTLPKLEGVAVTVMFRAPKWFFLRYKVMLDNALSNLPNATTWKVQVFINEPWIRDTVLPFHPGLQRLLYHDERVIVTPLPVEFVKHGAKPRNALTSTWFWESVAADRVLLFSGNGAFCGNVPSSPDKNHVESSASTLAWTSLLTLDYVGVPSRSQYGGDGGSHSVRYRPSMLKVLQYQASQAVTDIDGPEDRFFVDTMRKMNQDAKEPLFRIATREQTLLFGGVTNLTSDEPNHHDQHLRHLPLVVAGTHEELTYAERDALLKHCPELKVIFPSLHEPACFGAHPHPDTCRATICALQEPPPSHGC